MRLLFSADLENCYSRLTVSVVPEEVDAAEVLTDSVDSTAG